MNHIKLLIEQCTCKVCEKIFDNPIRLPCNNYICQNHAVNKSNYFCEFCKITHQVPEHGFTVDKTLNEIVQANKPIIFRNRTEAYLLLVSELENKLENYQNSSKNNLIEKHYENVSRQLDNRSASFLIEFKQAEAALKKDIEEQKANCLKRKLEDDNKNQIAEIVIRVNQCKTELMENKSNENQLEDIHNELEKYFSKVRELTDRRDEGLTRKLYKFQASALNPTKETFGKLVMPKVDSINANTFYLASGSSDGKIKLWDLNKRSQVKQLEANFSSMTTAYECLSDGHFATASLNTVKIRHFEKETAVKETYHTESNITCLKYLSNELLACGLGNSEIVILRLNLHEARLTESSKLLGHKGPIRTLIKLDNGDLASGSSDKTIRIWNFTTKQLKQSLIGHDHCILDLAQLPNGDLASTSADGTIKIWNLKDGIAKKTLRFNRMCEGANKILALPNGDLAASSERGNTIKIWDLKRDRVTNELVGHSEGVTSLVLLPNGDLASASKDCFIKVWDVDDGSKIFSLRVKEDESAIKALKVIPKSI